MKRTFTTATVALVVTLLLSFTLESFGQELEQLCTNPARTPVKRDNSNCKWYNDESCCTKFDALGLDEKTIRGKGCAGKINRDCAYEIIAKECALVCSTDAVTWYNDENADPTEAKSGPIRICKDFADKFWSKCRDSSYPDFTKGVCIPLKKVWNNSKDFVEEAFGMIYVEDGTRCMNTGSNLIPPFILNFLSTFIQSVTPVAFGSVTSSYIAIGMNALVLSVGFILLLPH